MAVNPDLLKILVCPLCKAPVNLTESGQGLKCSQCRRVYPIRDDIPVMLSAKRKLKTKDLFHRLPAKGPDSPGASALDGRLSAADLAGPRAEGRVPRLSKSRSWSKNASPAVFTAIRISTEVLTAGGKLGTAARLLTRRFDADRQSSRRTDQPGVHLPGVGKTDRRGTLSRSVQLYHGLVPPPDPSLHTRSHRRWRFSNGSASVAKRRRRLRFEAHPSEAARIDEDLEAAGLTS